MRVAWGEGSAGRGVGARGPWHGGGMRGRPAPRTSGYRLSPVRRWGWVGGAVGVGSWGRGRPLAAHLPWVPAFAGTTVGGGGTDLGGARVMGWGDALGGDAPRAAPLDSCLRRNDERGRAGMTIFAGMTIGGVGDGERCWGVGALRQAQGERGWEARVRWGGGMRWGETPHAAPLWIPAFAGMTGGCRGRRGLLVGGGPSTGSGRTDLGGARAMGCGGCDGGTETPRAAPSGFLPSQE